jgi:hypothetical protein
MDRTQPVTSEGRAPGQQMEYLRSIINERRSLRHLARSKDVRRAPIGPGLQPGPRCRPAGSAEGPTRTMRGVPTPAPVIFRPATGAHHATLTAWSCSCRATLVPLQRDRLRPVAGQPCAAAAAPAGPPPEGRKRSCGLATARPRRYIRSSWPLNSLPGSRQLTTPARPPGGPRRGCALETVENVVAVSDEFVCHVADRMRTSFRAWTGSWTGSPDNPSAAGAISAMTGAIGAARACAGREHASRNA